MLDHLPTARPIVDAGKHARIRGGINDPVGARERLHIAGAAHVAVFDTDARLRQTRASGFASRPAEIVDARKLDGRLEILQTSRDATSSKTANSSDKDLHSRTPGLHRGFIKL